ncbi:MAG: UDP-N-acetylmuramoyl-L-alanine--D-glutamate ligase [Thermoanaerobacteraceae bacterium]|uniref:UDP-N-acetylmuramoyl-L-alanine--D-glutamate ligase n=1 Tax=Thermanaeromonas sp. C210 TaxID=2731925 RepID=UPI00155CA615|nr:UDP-N-acetylmuramoyl-L-alanine--D-glutamate ligase [Thermanaeromonas sp. C210]MBE3581056.1 UDP-N-acetylmuramoyl-L-alanine--D-glutamate ligase [Thermoanaerobacteraceae bacterium]GFN24078.1 UDP-N-acetylmuramoylalanine--D-glutamate ligase [Thermanaeromonas sp. C210]
MDWKGSKVLVVGLGKSGTAAAGVLADLGAVVVACDKDVKGEEEVRELRDKGVRLILGSYPDLATWKPHLVVTSPGVPSWEPPLRMARELGIPVWGELELAYRLLPPRSTVIGITGTNGKTTTTALVGQMLQDAGYAVKIGGNIGTPLVAEAVKAWPGWYFVCEVSSFQLETVELFRPRVAVILNITPDHLDRHLTWEEYVRCKARLLASQEKDDFAVLNFDDPVVRELKNKAKGQVLFFSRERRPERGAFVQEGRLCLDLGDGARYLCRVEELALKGAHNLENALAAAAAAGILGVSASRIAHTLKTFPGVPHRLEFVAEIKGVQYINDSKGTNPEATLKALDAYAQPLILIAGGKNKGSDFTCLARKMRERVKHLILLGEAAPALKEAAQREGVASILVVRDLVEAVNRAYNLAEPGDVVLLSPACASWDMFKNYEERGELFKRLVRSLGEGGESYAEAGRTC